MGGGWWVDANGGGWLPVWVVWCVAVWLVVAGGVVGGSGWCGWWCDGLVVGGGWMPSRKPARNPPQKTMICLAWYCDVELKAQAIGSLARHREVGAMEPCVWHTPGVFLVFFWCGGLGHDAEHVLRMQCGRNGHSTSLCKVAIRRDVTIPSAARSTGVLG